MKVCGGNVSLALSVAVTDTEELGGAVRGTVKGPDAVPEYETVKGTVNVEKPDPEIETVPVAPALAPVALQVTYVPGGPEEGVSNVLAASPNTLGKQYHVTRSITNNNTGSLPSTLRSKIFHFFIVKVNIVRFYAFVFMRLYPSE